MKYIFLLILYTVAGHPSFSQADTSLLYLKFPNIPPFSITKIPDSSKFTKADLKKRKPLMIMIFSPDCDHCQRETKDLIANINLFKDEQILMVSHLDYPMIKKFYEDYQVADHPNITMGRDASYFLGTFFNIHNLPVIFLYDKKGNFKKAFEGSVSMKKIAEDF